MTIFHVRLAAAEDYLTRREPHRKAHIERLQDLRARGIVIGGGPAPDGRTADVTYHAEDAGQVERLITEDPYWRGGVWTRHETQRFRRFVDRLALPPVALDGSRRLTVVEGGAGDPGRAEAALVTLRDGGRVEFGGVLENGRIYALARSAEEEEARRWLAESGAFDAAHLTSRLLLYVL